MKYVVYEVWTVARVIEAQDNDEAYAKGDPQIRPGMNLCNWHVVAIPDAVAAPTLDVIGQVRRDT